MSTQLSICHECGAEFDLVEEGTMNVMPDDSDWYSCQDCHDGLQRLVEKMGF